MDLGVMVQKILENPLAQQQLLALSELDIFALPHIGRPEAEVLMTLQSKLAAQAHAKRHNAEQDRKAAEDAKQFKPIAIADEDDARDGSSPAIEALGEDEAAAFESALIRYVSLAGKIKALEAKKDGVRAIITETLGASGFKTLLTDDYSATYTEGAQRPRLDAKKLMEAGVTAEQLAKGTVISQTVAYVTVREIERKEAPAPSVTLRNSVTGRETTVGGKVVKRGK